MKQEEPTRTVVHIGYPKCASTYLQRLIFPQLPNFADLSDAPYEDKALLYHRGMTPEAYRIMVARHMRRRDDTIPFRILSCESYVELPFRGFERNFGRVALRRGIDPAPYDHRNEVIARNLARTWPDAFILIVIRNPLDWAVSRYDHWYRRDLVDEPLDSCLDEPGGGYDEVWRLYAGWFGREHVRVIPYERLRADPEGFVREAVSFADPDLRPEVPSLPMNAAPSSRAEVEYRRAGYRLKHRGGHQGSGRPLRRVARALLPCTRPFFRLRYGNKIYRSAVSPEAVRRLRPGLAASCSRLQQETGIDLARWGYPVEGRGV
ncbi:sulfotransferase [Kiritimatiella glycovorans]|uniref:Sulfotransferase domain protein n=1 Tax=Kiritimatiella glycovorans TaxID=1307763 RepID=A0A0G3EDB4_9BACT|nr:sulfotransferase [Kiritimatiella glycovorans]AKJ64451.1 Sulfotransferase domain protein [Kiritimatiella glycovorans]